MKTVAKIFLIIQIIAIIIGMIIMVGLSVYIGYLYFQSASGGAAEELTGIIIALPIAIAFGIGVVALIIPLVVNIIALKRLNDATEVKEIKGPAIVCLILGVNLISSIIMLCMKDEDLR